MLRENFGLKILGGCFTAKTHLQFSVLCPASDTSVTKQKGFLLLFSVYLLLHLSPLPSLYLLLHYLSV
jgi:hypothetical protein